MAYVTINPFTGETVAEFPETTDQDVALALDSAQEAFESWRERSVAERVQVLARAARLLREREEPYAHLITLEMGKLAREARAEIDLSARIIDYYVTHAERLLAPQPLPVTQASQGKPVLYQEPLGVLLAIEPWNFPFYQIARILAPQLAVGNTIVLKHASNVPQCALAFEKLMEDAGAPEGVYQNLFATREQLQTLIEDPRIQGVALTGSERAGSVVAEMAGKALKKSTLELGGSDAFIVLDDAPLDKTVAWAVKGRHTNAGQVCSASKRLVIADSLYDRFVEAYSKAVSELKAGDPEQSGTSLAPLSSQEALDRLEKQVSDAVAHGAKVAELGLKVPSQGFFAQPRLLENVTPDNPAYRWEFFGPVTQLYRAKDDEDALRIANDSPFGLGGSVFSADSERAQRVARRFSTGMVHINHPTVTHADLPFGGIRRSGYGRELTELGLKEFVNFKLVNEVDIDADL
ncbi:NAD-dependent succinate-semialdehyde dehydrogenase [Zymobacter palmae]|uniref:NAD-dependent aldehyde dehydrogenases n=1 Tax=Zymobacter palmae TaxID=33074 RepID=A0A348HFG0_9GAMM|nr:NAD-dependent succinate-semialdehyde dehydrogenase [Zymobacter palmae]BBG30362.1 NAD-dependent aldehyde dehydrogenases [Zymobacter palmae]